VSCGLTYSLFTVRFHFRSWTDYRRVLRWISAGRKRCWSAPCDTRIRSPRNTRCYTYSTMPSMHGM
jgi:hypothetical protein